MFCTLTYLSELIPNLSVTGFTFINSTRRQRVLTLTKISKVVHFCDEVFLIA